MFVPVARVTRNGLEESWHLGAVAVVAASGELMASAGDPDNATFLRSAAKPFQALPLLLAGGRERFALDAGDVALVCASHAGRPEHVERAASLLERGGFSIGALLCGAHPPFDDAAAAELRRQGVEPSPLHNNCSGKHAGMLLACALYGYSVGDYIAPQHPLQRAALEQLGRFCRCDLVSIGIGVDGCSAPAFRLPLARAAQGFAALVDPVAAGIPRAEATAARAVVEAMTAAPEMVAGPGRFTTRLMQVTRGRILGKEGAEGFYAAAVRAPRPLGIAVKIADGAERCRDAVVVEVLRQLGVLEREELAALEPYHRVMVRNHRAFFVGEIEPTIELEMAVPGLGRRR